MYSQISKRSKKSIKSEIWVFCLHHRFIIEAIIQTVRMSRSVPRSAQMLCTHTVRWRFMSQGASGARGYHIMWMMALLSRVPSQKTRGAGAGIQNMLRRTKDISLVVLVLNELSFCRRKQQRKPFLWCPSVTVWVQHEPLARIQAMANDEPWRSERLAASIPASLWSCQTKRQTCRFF